MRRSVVVIALTGSLFGASCGATAETGSPVPSTIAAVDEPSGATTLTTRQLGDRSFSLGFTPFPHAVSEEAVNTAYTAISDDGDLFAFHTTEGVPWTAAAAGLGFEGYGSNLQAKWKRHKTEMEANQHHEVYLGLTPLDDSRSRMADFWDESDHQPIPAAFADLAFDDPMVVEAYGNFVLAAVDWYEPDYLAIAIEGNLLKKNAPSDWPAFVSLVDQTYKTVKAEHPDLPVFTTVTAVDILEGWTDADHSDQMSALSDILASSDYLAVSFYPFMSVHLTGGWPTDTFEQLVALAEGRPIAFAETGYPAQPAVLSSYGLEFDGTEQKQDEWITAVLDAAAANDVVFVVNFVSRDYDELWETIGGGDLFAIWRDTGLYDEDGSARTALATWRGALAEPLNR